MKTSLQRFRRQQRGSLIVTAAVSAAVIAILVGGILTYISNEYTFNLRSHRASQALSLAEAGVEMGFAEYNNYYITGQGGFASSRGWSSGSSYYQRTTTFTNGAGEVSGIVTARVYYASDPNPILWGEASCATTPRGPTVRRLVLSQLVRNAKFPASMVAKNKLDLNGNNIYSDSFDSTDLTKSTSKLYDSSKRQAHGDVASNNTVENSVDVGNADIYGAVSVGPGGTVKMGKNGSIGPTFNTSDRADTIQEAQDNGWVRNDFQVDIPDATLPNGASSWSSLGEVSTTTTLGSGDFKAASINFAGTGKTLTISGTVRLYVTGDFDITGNSSGIIIQSGAKLEIYLAGSTKIPGNGVVNQTGQAINNQFYGLPSSTGWTLNGNGQWIGTVYAPQANVTLRGGGANGDMSGSIVANNVTLNGQTQFHYDEMLSTQGPGSSYNIASWKSYRYDSGGWYAD